MTYDTLQWIVAGVLIIAATGYLGRRIWQRIRGEGGGCGSCRGCAAASIVPVETLWTAAREGTRPPLN